ncbi:hypothetical protein ACWDLG_44630 [Nonomuraea sp. NPDC003727]
MESPLSKVLAKQANDLVRRCLGSTRKRIETLATGAGVTAGQRLLRWKFLHYYRDPLKDRHINFLGRYLFNIKVSGPGQGLRPFRDPDVAEDNEEEA